MFDEKLKNRLKKYYTIEGDHWIWHGPRRVFTNERPYTPARILYLIHKDPLLEKRVQLKRTCQVKNCVNPQHRTDKYDPIFNKGKRWAGNEEQHRRMTKLLRTLRRNLGHSQDCWAAACDVSRNVVQDWERGTTRVPAMAILQISENLNIPIEKFFSEE